MGVIKPFLKEILQTKISEKVSDQLETSIAVVRKNLGQRSIESNRMRSVFCP